MNNHYDVELNALRYSSRLEWFWGCGARDSLAQNQFSWAECLCYFVLLFPSRCIYMINKNLR